MNLKPIRFVACQFAGGKNTTTVQIPLHNLNDGEGEANFVELGIQDFPNEPILSEFCMTVADDGALDFFDKPTAETLLIYLAGRLGYDLIENQYHASIVKQINDDAAD